MENACCTFDFTISCDKDTRSPDEIIEWLNKFCKKYCFQKEKGAETGYLHYQGRISLGRKLLLGTLCRSYPISGKWSVTSKENMHNTFYVMKEETHIEGPWRDTDESMYIPIQYRLNKLFPWQEEIISYTKKFDTRSVYCIINKSGGIGKSAIVGYMCCNKMARKVPPLNNYKDIMRMVMCMPISKCYLIDMPRALPKKEMAEFYSAIESIKDGHVWDDRYGYKERWFDSPAVVVFTNEHPDRNYLSKDRWKIKELTPEVKGATL